MKTKDCVHLSAMLSSPTLHVKQETLHFSFRHLTL